MDADERGRTLPFHWSDLVALLVLAAAVLLFFEPVVSGRGWLPHGGGDSVSFIYPNYRFAAASLRDGQIPLWNPFQYAGAPFIADNQSGVFYPINLLLFLLVPDFSYDAIQWLVIGHFFLAGLATYLCLRLLIVPPSTTRNKRPPTAHRLPITAHRLHSASALLGSLAFMFSDLFITHIGNLNLIAVTAWLPLAFLGLHRGIMATERRRGLVWTIGGGVALGVSTLAGHAQMTLLLATFLGVYALYEAVVQRRVRPLLHLALLAAVAIGLSAITLFPAAEALRHTLRAEFDYERSTSYALPLQALTGLVAPDFFGRGAANFWGNWLRVEAGYAGVLPWFLAAVALFLRRNRQTIFFALAGLFFLLMALGPQTPLYPLLLRWLPIVPFQAPARFVLLLDFCLAVLAAVGLDALLRTLPASSRQIRAWMGLAAVLTLAVIATLLWQQNQLATIQPERQAQMLRAIAIFSGLAASSWLLITIWLWVRPRHKVPATFFAAIALALLFADLYGLGRYVEIDWNDPTPGFAEGSAALAFLKSDPGLHRLDIATGAWQPNLPQIERLYGVRGVYNPLQLANYNVYMGSVGFRGSTLYNLLGVKYVIGGKGEPPADTTIIVPVFDADPAVNVYLNTLALPRALVVFNAEIVASHDAAFEAIHQDSFDPLQTVILEDGRPLSQTPGQSSIEVLRYDLNQVAFRVTTDRPSYFLLTDTYHPQWRATVDGAAVPIEVANYAFRAIYLEPGTHEVEMRFVSPAWYAGVVLSLLTVVGLAAVLLKLTTDQTDATDLHRFPS